MDAAGEIVLEVDAEHAVWAYRPPTAALEAELARQVRALAADRARLKPPGQPAGDMVPAPEQWAAVQAAFASRLSVVTGGPGTGKTATIRLICAAADAQKRSVALVAPTGRAARRMEESTGAAASTIHSALGWIPGQGPTVDVLDGDLLIVDETSMANLELLVTLLRAVGGAHPRRARRRRRPARARSARASRSRSSSPRRPCRSPSSPTSSARRPAA